MCQASKEGVRIVAVAAIGTCEVSPRVRSEKGRPEEGRFESNLGGWCGDRVVDR